jgi:hypothetical protein
MKEIILALLFVAITTIAYSCPTISENLIRCEIVKQDETTKT